MVIAKEVALEAEVSVGAHVLTPPLEHGMKPVLTSAMRPECSWLQQGIVLFKYSIDWECRGA